jgi:hypothetical protein
MGLLIRNSFLLAKAEDGYGLLGSAITSTDALKIISMELNALAGTRVERNLIKGFLGADRQPLTNEHVAVTITFEWGGSGVAATAPRFSPLLQASGMNVAAVAEITGTPTAGGTNTLTLADLAGSNPASDTYLGFPIEITAGLGVGSKGVIIAHNGATREVTVVPSTATFNTDATSAYKIPAFSLYQPISTFGNGSSCTLVAVKDQNVHRIEGFRGSPALAGPLNGYGTFTITGVGRYVTPTAKASEAFVYSNQADPVPVTPRHTRALRFQGFNPCSEGFTFDWGNSTTFRSLIGCDPLARITDRPNPSGTSRSRIRLLQRRISSPQRRITPAPVTAHSWCSRARSLRRVRSSSAPRLQSAATCRFLIRTESTCCRSHSLRCRKQQPVTTKPA